MNIHLDRLAFLAADPRRIVGALHVLGTAANRRVFGRQAPDGVRVIEEEWNNLLILDACRYDAFAEHHPFERGRLEKRRSLGSDSWGFLQRNFAGERLHDTVYVSANPFTRTIPDGTFHAVHNLLGERWDDAAETVRPGDVVDATLALSEGYEDKRLIVHFMQPHYPFLGPTGEAVDSGGIVELDADQNPRWEPAHRSVWTKLRTNAPGIDVETVREAYRENLALACEHARTLLEELDGRTVVTSDHGNLFGERTGPIPARGYGHPRDLFVDELVEVPWYVVDGERRPTKPDPPAARDGLDEATVEDRLEALGYRD